MNLAEIFNKPTNFVIDWVIEKLKDNTPEKIYDILLQVISKNMLYFNLDFQNAVNNPVQDNIGWLDFTHGITFSNAVRIQCSKYPEYWKNGLLQMACFAGRNISYLVPQLDEKIWEINSKDQFFSDIENKILDHGINAPIFSAHLIKTFYAIKEEYEFASPECRYYLLASFNRFINSPIKAKHIKRTINQSIALVERDFK